MSDSVDAGRQKAKLEEEAKFLARTQLRNTWQ